MTFLAWLAGIELGRPAAQATPADACGAVDALVHRRGQLEREIVALLPSSPWQVQVGRLRCLRGIDTLSAAGLCSEIGDFERFARAGQIMSYVGLVPSEQTSGEQRRLGAITKTGSGHARRLLVEAAWHYRKRPAIGRALTDRQNGQPAEAIAIAWSAQQRLHRTWTRLEQRAKRRTIIAVAAARELAGSAGRSAASNKAHPHRHPVGWVGGGPPRARGTRDRAMSNPPQQGQATPDLRQRHPTTNNGPAATRTREYQPDRASRTTTAGPPPTQPTTSPPTERQRARSGRPG